MAMSAARQEQADDALTESQWPFSALAEAELPLVCIETRHMQAAPKAQINKSDPQRCAWLRADDAVVLYPPVH